jgi:transcriptional regulator GlxA family with amidase domain
MRKIAVLVFPGFELLDVFGPMEMFGLLKDDFALEFVSETLGAIPSNQRLAVHSTRTMETVQDDDIVFVPGGSGTRQADKNPALLQWIADSSARAEFTLSVCTGSLLLAKAGVLDGKRATTNKAAFKWVADQRPQVDWVRKARWVEDGAFFTSSGVSAGMDMALAVIARTQGNATAEQVAVWAEYDWHRDAAWDPFAKIHELV